VAEVSLSMCGASITGGAHHQGINDAGIRVDASRFKPVCMGTCGNIVTHRGNAKGRLNQRKEPEPVGCPSRAGLARYPKTRHGKNRASTAPTPRTMKPHLGPHLRPTTTEPTRETTKQTRASTATSRCMGVKPCPSM